MLFVVDTSIWVKLLRRDSRVGPRLEQALRQGDTIIVVPIVYYELMRGLRKRNDQTSIGFIERLWSSLTYADLELDSWEAAVRLWVDAVAKNQAREDADVLVAAAASVLQATVVTDNLQHFEVFGVPLENWAG